MGLWYEFEGVNSWLFPRLVVAAMDKIQTSKMLFLKRAIHSRNCILQGTKTVISMWCHILLVSIFSFWSVLLLHSLLPVLSSYAPWGKLHCIMCYIYNWAVWVSMNRWGLHLQPLLAAAMPLDLWLLNYYPCRTNLCLWTKWSFLVTLQH